MIVKLPLEKKVKLRDLCLQALRGNTLTIQFIASVIGTFISALPGVEFGRLHYRNLNIIDKINALARNNGNYRALMRLSETSKQELQCGQHMSCMHLGDCVIPSSTISFRD